MKKLLISLMALLFAGSSAAEVYKWVDKDGNVHFGDEQSADTSTAEKVEAKPANNYSSKEAMPEGMKKFLAAKEHERLEKEAAAKVKEGKSDKEDAAGQ